MPKFNIWIKNPYSFKYEESRAIQETLRCIYGGDPVYLKEWPVDHVSVDNVNITTARKMAGTIKAFHLQAALKDKNFGYYRSGENPALQVEVEVRAEIDGRPEWAREERGERT